MQKIRVYTLMVCTFLFVALGFAQQRQVGKATYYGKRAHGMRTSSGERYHRDSLTCAHRTYPFGTILKVHDLNTDKEVYVRVTDRGPFRRGTVIDLSYAAAKELNILNRGVSNVEITMADDVHIPYKVAGGIAIPQLEVKSPDGKGFCNLPEWAEKKQEMEMKKLTARAEGKNGKRIGFRKNKKDSIPRWKIFDKLCAQNDVDDAKDLNYLIK